MDYCETDIAREVGDRAFAAGKAYQRQGRVVVFERVGDGIVSQVRGSGPRPYRQTISLHRSRKGEIAVEGLCTCPVGYNCKHVAASLLQGLQAAARDVCGIPSGALSAEVADWLARLREVDARSRPAGEDMPQRLIYVLSPDARLAGLPRLRLDIRSVRLLKDGTLSKTQSAYQLDNNRHTRAPSKFLREADRTILHAILATPRGAMRDHAGALAGERGGEILDLVLETGRARWMTIDAAPLSPGPPIPGHVAWEPGKGGTLRATLRLEADVAPGLLSLNATPPVYVDPAAGMLGRVETGLAPSLVREVLGGPEIPAAQAALVGAQLRAAGTALAAAAPPQLAQAQVVNGPFQPVLRLASARMPVPDTPGFYGYVQSEDVGIACLAFRYGAFDIAPGEPAVAMRMEGLAPTEIHRVARLEKAALKQLRAAGFLPAPKVRSMVPPANEHDFLPDEGPYGWNDMLYRAIPDLERQGWRIEIAPDFPHRLLRGDGAFEARLGEGSGIDWFEFDLGVNVGGERLDLIGPLVRLLSAVEPDMLDALDEDEPLFLPLPDGRVLALPAGRIVPLIRTLFDLFGRAGGPGADGSLHLSRLDAAALADLEAAAGAGVEWQGGEGVRALGRALSDHGGIPDIAPPPWFGATLRPYQARGLAWLAFLKEAGLGGILADDMGLGKTVQALALIASEKAAGRLAGPVLVVAPTSLMLNWASEAERFAPDLSVLVLHGADRKGRFDRLDGADLVLTTYPLLSRDRAVLSERDWHMIVLDEAQVIKNAKAATTAVVHGLRSRHRFCLTGTPLENHLGEVWSLFHFVAPGFLGDLKTFTRTWRTPIEKRGDTARARLLAGRIKPFLLRRTKEEVATDLPAKTVTTERVDLEPAQRTLYESVRLTMHARVQAAIAEKGLARSHIVILDALLKLRQACCDPRLLKLGAPTKAAAPVGSAKLERLMELLVGLVEEGRKVIVFSQFTSMLDLVRPLLDEAAIPYALLTGDTADRGGVVASFQTGPRLVFLISLKAGGVGLNLTAADTVILYDPWWNPAVEDQAIDRAHRIGQDKPVFVYRLVAADTIEEKMEILKDRKRALAAGLFDHDGQPTLAMTQDDLDLLLGTP